MKILFAADGSPYTKKALAFLVTHESLAGAEDEVFVLNVQLAVPPRVKTMVGATTLAEYQLEDAEKVLAPIRKFLERHGLRYRTAWVVGSPATEIVKASVREKAHLIVMGTHGRGFLGRAVMGSAAQRVVADSAVPVLLVK